MTTQSLLQKVKRGLIMTLAVSLAWLQILTTSPVLAEEGKYVDSEGRDLTAVVECLPENYGKGNLQNAIAKFGNDYLERVLRLKDNTEDYKVSEDEKQFQECLKSKGIRPKS